MSEEAILNEIKHLRNDVTKIDKRMEDMETAINLIAVQNQQINNLDREVTKLWNIKDDCSKDLVEIKRFQASCPREYLEKLQVRQKETFVQQWTAIKILAGAMMSGFGILGAFIRWGV